MPLSSTIVNAVLRARRHEIDQRKLMAFAAGVGDARPELIDTARSGGIRAHPLFPVVVEWRSFLDVARLLVERGLSWDDAIQAEPLDYDLRWLGPIGPGTELVARVGVKGAVDGASGAVVSFEVDTETEQGEPVTRSLTRVLFPDIVLEPPVPAPPPRPSAARSGPEHPERTGEEDLLDLRAEWTNPDAVIRRGHRRVGAAAAHVFSECSGIWNPLFTDKAVALEHGRAFLALPHAGVLAMAVGGALQLGSADPSWVRRVRAEFGAPVPVPTTLEIEAEVPVHPSVHSPIRFRAHLEDGTPVINSGVLVAEPSEAEAMLTALRLRESRRRSVVAHAPHRLR